MRQGRVRRITARKGAGLLLLRAAVSPRGGLRVSDTNYRPPVGWQNQMGHPYRLMT